MRVRLIDQPPFELEILDIDRGEELDRNDFHGYFVDIKIASEMPYIKCIVMFAFLCGKCH